MKIGDLARLSGTAIETIRFYEREKLLSVAGRTAGNYRIYEAAHAERLAFIRHCRLLDMTLDEIRVLLRLRDAPSETCTEVNRLLDEHIGHVSERMRELRALDKQLKTLRDLCHEGNTARECGILQGLSREAKGGTSRSKGQSHVQGAHGPNK